jgi:hypothetical protein
MSQVLSICVRTIFLEIHSIWFSTGNFEYRVTLDSLMDRLNTDMHAASCSIPKEIRFIKIAFTSVS